MAAECYNSIKTMHTREVVDLKGATGQIGFGVDQQQRFTINLLDQVLGKFGSADTVSRLIFSRKVWQERPQKRGVSTAIFDLLDATNRRLYFMDDNKHLYGDQPFSRGQNDKLHLSLAVVLIKPLTAINEPVIKADLEAIGKQLAVSGGLIVVEKREAGQQADAAKREAVLEYTSGFKYNRLKHPEFLVSTPEVIVWETRRKKPNKTWQAIQKRNQERINKAEGVGTHVFENLNAGLEIVEVGGKTISTSRVGEEDGLGPKVGFTDKVVVPEIKTNAERRLSFGLPGQEKKEKSQPKNYLLGSRDLKVKCSLGNPITETIWTEGQSATTGKIKLRIAHTCSCHGDLDRETKYVRPNQIINTSEHATQG